MKKILYFTLCVLSVFALVCSTGCSRKKNSVNLEKSLDVIDVKKDSHSWYYFSYTNFEHINKPQNSPSMVQTPWTEALRISSANNAANLPDSTCKGYAVVNKLGILVFENDSIKLSKDINLFNQRTAGNIVFLNNTPLFSVYKSSFFNDTITDPLYKRNAQHLFLVQFDDTARIAYPVVNCNNICDEINSEVTDFSWNGFEWICSVKTISDVKNTFSYVKWKPTVSLLSISPSTAKDSIVVSESNVSEFRNAKAFIDYKNVPERIKKLLAGFSKEIPFYVEVKTAGGTSPRRYLNSAGILTDDFSENELEQILNAKAIISQSWSGVLFEDGTLFIEGALPGKHILRGGKPVVVRLPKLPDGFKYSEFVISGTTLYASWEESSFYTTGRSGFIQVNLDKTLYAKIL